jgi:hypothetical protein
MGDYRRRSSTLAPEVREALRTSPHLRELRRTARSLQLSFRRQPYRVGSRLVWRVAERGPGGREYGWVELLPSGLVLGAELFGAAVESYAVAAYTEALTAGAEAARTGVYVELHPTGPLELVLLEQPQPELHSALPVEELLPPESIPDAVELSYAVTPRTERAGAWLLLLLGIAVLVTAIGLGSWALLQAAFLAALAAAVLLSVGGEVIVRAVRWNDRLLAARA